MDKQFNTQIDNFKLVSDMKICNVKTRDCTLRALFLKTVVYLTDLPQIMKSLQRNKCLKNKPCDVVKLREMRGEEGKKTPKKEMDNH